MDLNYLIYVGLFLLYCGQGLLANSFDENLSVEENLYKFLNDEKPRVVRQFNPGLNLGLNCICVPQGQCNTNPITTPTPNPNPNDGSGNIDIRIVSPNQGGLIPGGNPNNFPFPFPSIVNPTQFPPNIPCNFGLVRCCQPGSYQCGVRYPPPPGSRLPSLDQSPFGAYPWHAAILSNFDNSFQGSGALIDNRHILTAAHKVANYSNNVGAIKVRLGEWDTSNTLEPIPAQDVMILRIFVNPSFSPNNLFNDIAIIRLATPITLGSVSTIATVCLPPVPTPFGAQCFISGWGKNSFVGTFEPIQKHTDVTIRTQSDCERMLRGTKLGPNYMFNSQSFICAGGENGKDACTGDGGSPLVCSIGGRWAVYGLVAWGIGCGTPNVPGVYVNVFNFYQWIQQTIVTA